LRPGFLVLLGSGETSTVGGQVFDLLVQQNKPPISIGILETPAGFELNSAYVAGRIGNFLTQHLQNYHPEVKIIPARKKGTPFSPDSPEIIAPLLTTHMIFLGPGSPSYAVSQLAGSLAWDTIRAMHRHGASLIMASAAAIASGKLSLPVYEIYKVGEDPYWKEGLDLLGYLGLSLVVVPHWNNAEGGAELDTRRCFMGGERFKLLQAQIDPSLTLLGIDENTALSMDFNQETCRVIGRDNAHVFRQGQEWHFSRGETFPLSVLGNVTWADAPEGIPALVWEKVTAAHQVESTMAAQPIEVPEQVMALVSQRQDARTASNWSKADILRQKVQELGWSVIDTPEGPVVQQKNGPHPTRVPRTQSPTSQ